MITPAEAKAARKLLGWSQQDVAGHMAVNETAIGAFERKERRPVVLNLAKLQRLFEGAGVEFPEGEAVRLKARAQTIPLDKLNASNYE